MDQRDINAILARHPALENRIKGVEVGLLKEDADVHADVIYYLSRELGHKEKKEINTLKEILDIKEKHRMEMISISHQVDILINRVELLEHKVETLDR